MLYIRICPSFTLRFSLCFKYFYSFTNDQYPILYVIRFYHLIFKINFLIFLDIIRVLAKNEKSNIIYLPYFYVVINFISLYLNSQPKFQ